MPSDACRPSASGGAASSAGTADAPEVADDPASADPAPGDSALSDPASGDPAPGDPAPGDPAPGDPAPQDGGPGTPAAVDWDRLPEPVRSRLAEVAAVAVAGLAAVDVPQPLRRLVRFTPAKRAKLGAAP